MSRTLTMTCRKRFVLADVPQTQRSGLNSSVVTSPAMQHAHHLFLDPGHFGLAPVWYCFEGARASRDGNNGDPGHAFSRSEFPNATAVHTGPIRPAGIACGG